MFFFRKKEKEINLIQKNWKIKSKCLDLLLACSKSNYPNEFGGFLRAESNKKDTISEVVILPGTISGKTHAIFQLHMRPIDFSIVGTVHSHPSNSFVPSDADLHLFQKHGKIHIIIANPFDNISWRAYNSRGDELKIEVIT
ncbi:MAG: Mov34/MPN/PAD-1 family protein [Thermoplasmatales archaeon]|nr:MAG: Mov34/MPN/PAD-1 family protein [Thermoplasmatales archaeon]